MTIIWKAVSSERAKYRNLDDGCDADYVRAGLLSPEAIGMPDMEAPCGDAEAFCEKFTVVARAALPELPGLPLYAVTTSQLGMDASDTLGGLTGPSLHHTVRQRRPDLYQGPGPVIVVNDVVKARAAIQTGLPFDWEFPQQLLPVLCHELGHVVESLRVYLHQEYRDWAAEQDVSEVAADTQRFVRRSHAHDETTKTPRWQHHDWRFIRATLHVCYRLGRLGCLPDLRHVLCPDEYGLHLADYAQAMEIELTQSPNQNLREVLATTPPKQFMELWRSDTERANVAHKPVREDTMTDGHDKVRELLKALDDQYKVAQKEKEQDSQKFIRRLAEKDVDDVDELAAEMKRLNYTPESLQVAVSKYQHRLKLHIQWLAGAGLDEERDKLLAAKEKADKKMAKARAEHQAVVLPLVAQLQEIEDKVVAAQLAKTHLVQTVAGDRKRALDALSDELGEVGAELMAAEKMLRDLQTWSEGADAYKEPGTRVGEQVERARRYARKVPQQQNVVDELRKRRDELKERLRALEAECLLP